jgi:LMBR1 domain-containing protein 1
MKNLYNIFFRKNETYMNSFLFNVMLVLLSTVSITQFCTACFDEYTAMSDIALIFSVQIRYLVFFVYFYKYHIFEYTLLGIFVISSIYLLCRPSDINSVENIVNNYNIYI